MAALLRRAVLARVATAVPATAAAAAGPGGARAWTSTGAVVVGERRVGPSPAHASASGASNEPRDVAVRTYRYVVRKEGALAIEYDSYGDETDLPVILLHGGGQTRHSWTATAVKLANAGFNAIAVDLKGHGNSYWDPKADYTPPSYADDLVALTGSEALRHRPVVVVGASLGLAGLVSVRAGGLTLLSGAKRIANLEAAVLVDITPKMERNGVNRILSYMRETMKTGFATVDDAATSIQQYTSNRTRSRNLESVRKNLRQGADGRFYWHWDPAFVGGEYYDRTDLDDDELRRMYEAQQLEAARSIKVPLLLIRGRSSDLVSEETAKEFVQQVPGSEYIDVANARHMVAGDSNDIFSNALIAFLDRKIPPERRHAPQLHGVAAKL